MLAIPKHLRESWAERVAMMVADGGLAREAALRGKRVAVLPPEAYGGYKDVNEAWAAGVLVVRGGPAAVGGEVLAVPTHLREPWAERVAIMVADGGLACEAAERLAWEWLQAPGAAP